MRTVCTKSALRFVFQFRGNLLIALAAVGKMRAHRSARAADRVGADRANDLAVLGLNARQISAALGRRGYVHPDGLARDDEAPEVVEEPNELRIGGGFGDPAM